MIESGTKPTKCQREIYMYIKRDKYLNDIINRMHNGMIKVITGIRRSGKSYLVFNIFNDYLKSEGVAEDHIIKIELDDRKNKKYVKIKKNPLNILEIRSASYSEEYGTVWKLYNYSVVNPSDIILENK